MAQRLTYYVSSLYVSQLGEGHQYLELCPAISICVLSQAMFAEPPALHLDFRLREVSTARTLTDDLQIHLLQLNHLQVTAENVYDASPAELRACQRVSCVRNVSQAARNERAFAAHWIHSVTSARSGFLPVLIIRSPSLVRENGSTTAKSSAGF